MANLLAAFLLLLGWLLGALRQEERLLISVYVSISEKNWHSIPSKTIEFYLLAFKKILGPNWSIRSIFTIMAYSVFCYCIIKLPNYSGEQLTYWIIYQQIIMPELFFGTLVNILSNETTRTVMKMKMNISIRLIVDIFIAIFFFSSSITMVLMMINWPSLGQFIENYAQLFLIVTSQFFFEFEIAAFDEYGHFASYSLISMFPTFSYLILLLISIISTIILQFTYNPILAILDLFSRLPSKRLILILNGLGALIVLQQAWVTYRG